MMNCPFCGRCCLSTSRLRRSDLPQLLIGFFPMRCRDCVYRFFVWLPLVLIYEWTGEIEKLDRC